MTTSYTSLLGLALPVTGELQGTWGDTVNNYITSYLDASVAGTQTISGSQTAVTLSVTNGSSLSQAGSGSTGSSQYSIINCTGNPAGLLTITVPAASKIYLILNATSTSQSVKIVGAGPTTGVTVVSGEKALVAWNGSDFVKIATAGGTATFTNVTVTGTTTLSGLTASTALALDASKNVVSVTNTGTGNNVLSASPTLTGTVGLADLTASGSVTLSGGTANGVLYLNASKVATSGSALTFDGVILGLTYSGANPSWSINRSDASTAGVFSIEQGNSATFISSSTTKPLAFYLNGSEQMRLTSTGLGIGTSSPENKLTLVKNTTAATENTYGISVQSVNTNGYTELLLGASDAIDAGIIQTAAKNTNFTAKNLALQPQGGNVGIGTSSPNSPAGSTQTTLHISNATAGKSPGIHLTNGDTGTAAGDGTLIFVGDAAATGTTSFNIYNQESSPIVFFTATAERARIDAAGNFGLGVTPSAWDNNFKVFQLGYPNFIAGNNGGNRLDIGVNAYFSTNYKYANSAAASYYSQSSGQHIWYTAASGTAGNAITFTQAMTLDASGNLGVGTSSPSAKLDVNGSVRAANNLLAQGTLQGYSGAGVFLSWESTYGRLEAYNYATSAWQNISIAPNGGNVGIGTSSPASKLQVNGTGTAIAKIVETSTTGYTGLSFANTGSQVYSLGMGGASETAFGVANKFFLYDSTAGAMRMVVDTSGNVGIGTSSPSQKLEVAGKVLLNVSAPQVILNRSGTTYQSDIKFQTAGTNNWSIGQALGAVGSNLEFYDYGVGATRMQIDTSGNLGLGVTPSTWSAGKAFELSAVGNGVWCSPDTYLIRNCYYNSGWKYASSAAAANYYIGSSGEHVWSRAASGTAGNAITFTQAMTLDASGNLGVGTTSPYSTLSVSGSITLQKNASNVIQSYTGSAYTNLSYDAAIHVWSTSGSERARIDSSGNFGIGTTSPGSYGGYTTLAVNNATNGGLIDLLTNGTRVFTMYAGSTSVLGTVNSSNLAFYTVNTERARFDTSGNLLVGTTSTGLSNSNSITLEAPGGAQVINHPNGTATGSYYLIFGYNAGLIGSITQNGTTAVAYNTGSDYRLKNNQQPLIGSGAFIDALKPKTWEWKADGSQGVGFIAHEVQEVSPGSVVGEKDAVDEDGKPIMQAMEYGSAEFIANIIAELQSLRQRVAQLEKGN